MSHPELAMSHFVSDVIRCDYPDKACPCHLVLFVVPRLHRPFDADMQQAPASSHKKVWVDIPDATVQGSCKPFGGILVCLCSGKIVKMLTREKEVVAPPHCGYSYKDRGTRTIQRTTRFAKFQNLTALDDAL